MTRRDRRLVGRADDIAVVRAHLQRVTDGHAGILLVEGEPGIGKTALLDVAAVQAERLGISRWTARGGELESELPFGIARQLLAQPRTRAGPDVFTGPAALADEILSVLPTHAEGRREGAQPQLFAALHGLYWLTAALVDREPTVMVVDDAHWSDLPSLQFLSYLSRRMDGLPLGLVVAMRPDLDGERQALLNVLAAEPAARSLRLGPLSRPAVDMLVKERLGEPVDAAFAEACHRVTGGNAFLVAELLEELRLAQVRPDSVAIDRVLTISTRGVLRSVQRRLSTLPLAATHVLEALAVFERSAQPRHVAHLAAVEPPALTTIVDQLVRVRILDPAPPLAFAHPLIRSAVLAAQGPATLARRHRVAAGILAADGADDDEIVPHLLAADAQADPWTVEVLRRAARRALSCGAPELAARYLARAIDEPAAPEVRGRLFHESGMARALAGDPAAADDLVRAVELTDDPDARCRASIDLVRVHFLRGRLGDAVAAGADALTRWRDASAELRLELTAEFVSAARQHLPSRALCRRHLAAMSADDLPPTRAASIVTANLAVEELAIGADRERTLALADAALDGARLFHPQGVAALPLAAGSLALAGQIRRSMTVWDTASAKARHLCDVQAFAMCETFRCFTAGHGGEIGAAVAAGRSAVDTVRAYGLALLEPHAVAYLALALLDRGETDAAADELGSALAYFGEPLFAANYLLLARGRLHLGQGRLAEAVEDLRECGRRVVTWGVQNPALCPWRRPLVVALQRRGDVEEARALASEELRLARRWGAAEPLAAALRCAGDIADPEVAGRLLEESLEVAERSESRLEQAGARLSLGRLRARDGRRSDARALLRGAADVARRCGATGLAADAHRELLATGARPRRLPVTGVESLTGAERRVAELACEGLTNRAIAQSLFLAEKTVESHLAKVYRKLAITARSEISPALRG